MNLFSEYLVFASPDKFTQHTIHTIINSWLCANKLSLNIDKTSFVIFHPPQRKVTFNFHLTLNGKKLQQDSCIKYLGILIDSNLSWKPQIASIAKKTKRSIGILSKLRHYVNSDQYSYQPLLLFNLSISDLWYNYLG